MADPVLVVKEPKENIVVANSSSPIVAVVNIGTPGEKGASGGAHFEFEQGSAASEWNIVHNLGKHPSVTVQDSAGENVEGFCEYKSINEIKLIFSAAFGGVAYLN